jgi:hypothetical protein
MGIEKTPEELTVIRHKYEHTGQPVEEIARNHRMGSRTLYSWARLWNWTPRRAPMPAEGPPPTPPPPQIASAAPLLLPAPQGPPLAPAHADASAMNDAPDSAPVASQILAPQIDAAPLAPLHAGDATLAPGAELSRDPGTPSAVRLHDAVASVLAAIEAIVAKIGAARLGESDRSARALAALTRTLRELNSLQSQYEEPAADDSPADIDEFRHALAAKIDAFVAAQGGGVRDDAEPEGA